MSAEKKKANRSRDCNAGAEAETEEEINCLRKDEEVEE